MTIPVPQEIYWHYKRGRYMVLAVANYTEAEIGKPEKIVVYVSLDHGTVWARPLSIWNKPIPMHGSSIPRFVREE